MIEEEDVAPQGGWKNRDSFAGLLCMRKEICLLHKYLSVSKELMTPEVHEFKE